MNKILFLCLLLSPLTLCAQLQSAAMQEVTRRHHAPVAKATIASPALEDYDVKYVKLDLSLSHLNTTVSGNATTRGVVTAATGMSQYVFELSDSLTIDSMKFNGAPVAAANLAANLRIVMLPGILLPGTAFTAQVFYHGTGANGTGFFTHGLNHATLGTGTNITYTLSDPYLARDWWPCKQSLTDKIDSAELWYTVPAGTRAGGNGRLAGITAMPGGAQRFEWKTRYPIEYYLISAAVAPYADHTQMLHFSGSADSMPVVHYVYDTASFYPLYKSALDSTPYMVDYLSTLYGRYPFWQEKYGHCTAPLGGGMEHQTMTTLGAYTTPLIAHELGHQWWGDCVTYSSWADIWMSEGWASYTEQLYVEHFQGVTGARTYRTNVFNRILAKPGGTVYVDDTTDVYRIFDSRLTYDKGAAVAHMLRYLAPDDNAFFSGLRAYQQRYAFRTANTDSFRAIMQTAYGRPLDTFFNQWIYGAGYPTYSATWNQRGSTVFVQLTQTTSVPASVAAFALPVTLRLSSATGDTLVKAYLSTAQQLYTFTWGREMTGIAIDPLNDIVNKNGSIANDPALSVASPAAGTALRIAPNPATGGWQISGIAPGAALTLSDAAGKIVWQQDNAPGQVSIDSSSFPPGSYQLSVRGRDGRVTGYKLQKR